MRTFRLHKLIRDNVLDNMQAMGQQTKHSTLASNEFQKALQHKLIEETHEFDVTKPNATKELADILEVVQTLALELGMDFEELRALQLAIRQKRGGFDKRVFIETVTLADNDSWVSYYQNEPERFLEIN